MTMRRTNAFGLVMMGLLIAACGGAEGSERKPAIAPTPEPPAPIAQEPPPAPPAPPAEPAKSAAELQLATQKTSFEAWNAGDAKKVAATFAENATLLVAGMPEIKGREAIEAYVRQTMKAFSKTKLALTRTFQKGDVMAVEWVFNGTHAGEYMGLKATEKPVGFHGASLVTTKTDGSIREQHDYFDVATIMAQVGASKPRARPIPSLPASAEGHAAKGAPDEEKNAELVKAFYAAMEKKSESQFTGALADTVLYEDFTQPEVSKGRADAKRFFGMFTKAFPDAKQAPTTLFGIEDFVIVEAVMTGTQKGPLGPIPPTKKAVALRSLDVLQLKDGKIAKGWTYSNGAELMTQLGLLKAPPPAAKPAPGVAHADESKGADAKSQQGRAVPPPAANSDIKATSTADPSAKGASGGTKGVPGN